MKVWVIEEGDYEQRCVVAVGASPEACVRAVKAIYGKPYVVRWEQATRGLIGHFEAVNHYSTKHTAVFDFTQMEVVQ